MTLHSITNLFLVEHDYQAEDLLNRDMKDKGEWIALGPSAMHYLSQKGIHYTIPEDYCSREEVEDVCISQFERLKEVCKKMDEFLHQGDPFLKEWGIRPFLFHLWQLGHLFDVLECRTLQLKKILEHHQGSKVFVHAAPQKTWAAYDIRFAQDETLWGRLLQLPEWNADVYIFPEPRYQMTDTAKEKYNLTVLKNCIKDTISHSLRRNLKLYALFQSFFNNYLRNVLNILKLFTSNRKSALAILNGAYEWDTIMPHIMAEGYPVYILSGPNLVKTNLSSINLNNSYRLADTLLMDIRGAFSEMLVNYFEIIVDRLRYIIEHASTIAQGIVKNIEPFFSDKRIRCLLTSVGFDFGSYIVKQFCRKRNIKVLSWQHGAEWYDKRITQRNDLLNLVSCDKMLVFGDGVKYAYESSPLLKEERCEVISLGMQTLEGLKEISYPIKAERIRVLWPFGGYYRNGWYCGFSPPYSDRICYKEQMIIAKKIIMLLKKYSYLSLTIKLYPSAYLADNPPWIADFKNMDRIRIVYVKPSFSELLREHDAIFIESPTTTLLQAIATRLPVFVLLSIIHWPNEAINLLQKRAYCANSAKELMLFVEQYINNDIHGPDIENQEFLKFYGLYHSNGRKKALSLINSFLEEKETKF